MYKPNILRGLIVCPFILLLTTSLWGQCPGAYDNVVICEVSGDSGQSDGANDAIVEICGPPGTNIGCMVISDSEFAVVIPSGATIPADGTYLIACSYDINGSGGVGLSSSPNGIACDNCDFPGLDGTIDSATGPPSDGSVSNGEIDMDVCDPDAASFYDPAASGFTLDNTTLGDGEQIVLFQPDGTPHDGLIWGAPGPTGAADNCTLKTNSYTLGDNDGNGIVNDNPLAIVGGRCDGNNAIGVPVMPDGDCMASDNLFTIPAHGDAIYNDLGNSWRGCNSSFIRIDVGTSQGSTATKPSHKDGSYTDQPIDANGNPTAIGSITMETFSPSSYIPTGCGGDATTWSITDHPTPGQPNDDPTFAFYVDNAVQCAPGVVTFTVEVYNYQNVEQVISNLSPGVSLKSGSFVFDPIVGSEQAWTISSVSGVGSETTTFTYTQTTPGPGTYAFNLVWDDFTACCGSGAFGFGSECLESEEIIVTVATPMTAAPTFTCTDGQVVVTTVPADATGITYELLDDPSYVVTGGNVVQTNTTGQFLVTTAATDNYFIRVSQEGDCSGPFEAVGTVCVFSPPCPEFTAYSDCTTDEGTFCPGATIDIAVDGNDLTPGALIEFVSLAIGDTDPYDNPASDVVASCIVPDPTIEIGGVYNGATGNFFAYQDIDDVLSSASQSMTISGLNISGQTGLSLCVDLAEDSPYNSWEGSNTFLIDIDIDGGGTTPVITVDDNTGATALATDISGAPDITSTFQTYTSSIAGTGSTAVITITMDANAGNEDLGFDNLILKSNETPGGIYILDFDSNNSGYTLSDMQASNGSADYFGVVGDGAECKSISVSLELCGDLNIAPRMNPEQTGCNMATGGDSETPTLAPLTYSIQCPEASITAAAIDVCEAEMSSVDIEVIISGGSGTYTVTYAIDGTSQTPLTGFNSGDDITIMGATSGEIKVTLVSVVDEGGSMCPGSVNDAEVCVNLRPTPTATIAFTSHAAMCAPCDGSATVTFTGNGPFDFEYTINGGGPQVISGVSSPYVLTGLCAGTYALSSVSDEGGCTGTISGSAIIDPPASVPTLEVTTAAHAVCNDGTGTVNLTTDVTYSPDYSAASFYFFGIDPNSLPLDPLDPSTFTGFTLPSTTVTVPTMGTTVYAHYIDPTSGCPSTVPVVLTTNASACFTCPTLTTLTDPADICVGETFDLSVTGLDATQMNQTTGSGPFGIEFIAFSGMTAPTDAYAATGTSLGTVANGALINSDTEAEVSGVGGSLTAGDYQICAILSGAPTDTDCRPQVCVEVTVNAIPTLSATSSDPTTCGGTNGSIALTLTNVADGTYTIDYMDATPVAQTFTGVVVSSGSVMISGLSQGTYNNLIITVNGCTSSEDVDISLSDPATPDAPTTSNVNYCVGDMASVLSATGTGTLTWYNVATGGTALASAPTPSTATAGVTTYYVSQTVAGCESSRASIMVTVNESPSVNTDAFIQACEVPFESFMGDFDLTDAENIANGDVDGDGMDGSTATVTYYSDPDGMNQITNGMDLPPADIYAEVELPNGCSVIVKVTVELFRAADFTASPTASTTCDPGNGSITLSGLVASTGYALDFTDPSGTMVNMTISTDVNGEYEITGLVPGTYNMVIVSVQPISGLTCPGPSFNVTVDAPDTPDAPTTNNINYCVGDMASALTATGTGTLTWYDVATGGTALASAPTPSTAAAGVTTYYVSQTVAGCESSRASLSVAVFDVPTLSAIGNDPSMCGATDGSIALTQMNVPDGTYSINYTDASGMGQTFAGVTITSGMATITGLGAGMYNDLSITNHNCTSVEDVDIQLTQVCDTDVALQKMVSSAGPYKVGDKVNYTIVVHNQGSQPIYNVTVVDYLPVQLDFLMADNSMNDFSANSDTGGGGIITTTVAMTTPIAGGATYTIDLILTVNSSAAPDSIIQNDAEITNATMDAAGMLPIMDEDDDLSSRGGGTEDDDNVADNTMDDPNDQDDFDFARIRMCGPNCGTFPWDGSK